jgi:ABC-type oligopeptide transport system substrate-binding subunit
VTIRKEKFPELLKLEKQCKISMRVASWIADYPDGDNFMQLLYGPNTFQSNNACAKIPEYDALYARAQKMPAGPERDKLYQQMTRIIEAYAPWRLTISRYRNQLIQPRVQGYRRHPILHSHWQYLDVGPAAKP